MFSVAGSIQEYGCGGRKTTIKTNEGVCLRVWSWALSYCFCISVFSRTEEIKPSFLRFEYKYKSTNGCLTRRVETIRVQQVFESLFLVVRRFHCRALHPKQNTHRQLKHPQTVHLCRCCRVSPEQLLHSPSEKQLRDKPLQPCCVFTISRWAAEVRSNPQIFISNHIYQWGKDKRASFLLCACWINLNQNLKSNVSEVKN